MSLLDMSKQELATNIKLTNLNGETITVNPKKLLLVSKEQLSYDIQNMATWSYTIQRAKDVAQLDYQNMKQEVANVYGQLYNLEIANPALRKKNNGRKPTDAMVNSAIVSSKSYTKLVKQRNYKEYVFQLLKDLSYDLTNKSNLLQTESSNLRQEQKIRENNI